MSIIRWRVLRITFPFRQHKLVSYSLPITIFAALSPNRAGMQRWTTLPYTLVILEVEQTIVDIVSYYAIDYDYVFTAGSIDPTHDDIKTASVAKAFNKKLIRYPAAVAAMKCYYDLGQLTYACLKMSWYAGDADLLLKSRDRRPGRSVIEYVRACWRSRNHPGNAWFTFIMS